MKKVNYPGLASHPQHALAKKQMSGFGAMISFDLGSFENAGAFLGKVRLCSLGESLGGVETLISHPATMTHASIPEEERNRLGVTPGPRADLRRHRGRRGPRGGSRPGAGGRCGIWP